MDNVCLSQNNWQKIGLGSFLALLLVSCQSPPPVSQPSPSSTPNRKSQLSLTKATLEQSNVNGQTLWKIQVEEAVYSPDRKNATLSQVKGDLYNDGKIVLKVQADKGEIKEDGNMIVLKNNIVAVDPRNKAVLRSQEVEWQPKSSVLIARKDLKGEHPELRVTAREGRYDTNQQALLLTGNIVAIADTRRLELKTDSLQWDVPQNKLIGTQPMKLVRFEGKEITDQVIANQAEVWLKTKQVLIKDNSEFRSLKPPLQVAVKTLTWDYEKRTIESQEPVQIVDYQNQMTITGNRGRVDFNREIAWLTNGTKGRSEQQQSQLFADQLIWNMRDETLEALGNVIYEQSRGVKFNLTGDKAIGSLVQNTVVVTSYRPERVVTEIYPSPR